MKFSDFFLPKIARSDPEVRKKAVRIERNVAILKKVSLQEMFLMSHKKGIDNGNM